MTTPSLTPESPVASERGHCVERLVRRVTELEDCLREIERRLREDTGPILNLIRDSKSPEAAKAWKGAIYASAIRAQVFLSSPNVADEPRAPAE